MKIGILGAGHIAEKTAPTMAALAQIECYAVSSRSRDKAEAFARRFGFEKAYGSYEEMLSDPEVELVYIATPHSHHYEHMLLCLEYGKPILCEKAFTLNAAQARDIREKAAKKGIFVAEAIWTRYMPSRQMINDVIASGIIGKVNTLTANLSYAMAGKERIHNPALGGGTLLDIGVYGINFALMHFGCDIERVDSSVRMLPTGVDGMETITLHYRDGRMAVLTHSCFAQSDRKGMIHGDKGYIVIENINNPQSIAVYDIGDHLLEYHAVPAQISGYEYEFLSCAEALKQGKTEADDMPLSETVAVMEFMDSLRARWDMVYPQER